jgi:hypothetical protein
MDLTPLERAILEWIGRTSYSKTLLAQIQLATVSRREPSDDGYVAHLELPAEAPLIDQDEILHNPLHGPNIASPSLDDDGGATLNLSGNRVETLEVFSFGSTRLDEYLNDFDLS